VLVLVLWRAVDDGRGVMRSVVSSGWGVLPGVLEERLAGMVAWVLVCTISFPKFLVSRAVFVSMGLAT